MVSYIHRSLTSFHVTPYFFERSDGIRTASTTNEHENCNDMMQSNCILLDMNGNNVTSGIPEDTPDGVLLGVSMKSVKQFKEAYNSRLTEIQQNNTWAIK